MFAPIAFLLLVGQSATQTAPPTVPLDTPGRITGRVMIRGENVPVGDARVMLMQIRRSPPVPGTIPGPPAQAMTSADGRFVFDRVPPGEYRLTAEKTGLAVGPGVGQPSAAVTVAPGQAVESPELFLERAGAIAGRILDSNGDPLVEAQVMALRRMPIPPAMAARGIAPQNRPLLPAGRSGQTNDLGEFRIFGLPPGDYFVASRGRMQSPVQTTSPAPKTTLATTYFPSVTDAEAAQAVSVAAGQTINGIEIRMTLQPAFQISGIVVGEDGTPIEGAMVSMSSGTPGPLGPHSMSRTDASGRFRIVGVPSGSYRLYASRPTVSGVSGGVSSSFSSSSFSSGGVVTTTTSTGSSSSQQQTVTVADANVTGVRILLVQRP